VQDVHGESRLEAPPAAPPTWAIVLAAGSGSRFGGAKQYARAAGLRLVDLAVEAALATCQRVLVVLQPGTPWDGRPVDAVVDGGADRGASVRNALRAIPATEATVLVHQAANPLASPELIRALLGAIEAGASAAVPGLRPADLVRRVVDGRLADVVGRDELVLVQTPAAFRLDVLRAAHVSGVEALEDTERVSAIGEEVRVVPGDPRNIHVATPEDLEVVTALLQAAGR
jgi:2-C-methyl-D-erythritol 4-phosphate cytidylyltransferase